MLYIVGTRVSTINTEQRAAFDPLAPTNNGRMSNKRIATWLPVDLNWVLGRISKTPDQNTYDYMFYCEQNPKRTHVVTFKSMEEADQAIAVARGEMITNQQSDDVRKKVDTDEKFDMVRRQLDRKNSVGSRGVDPRRGGRPGNMNRRMGR